ncbi:MAG: thioredoxin TrxC [Gammaproteobacteria bacterium]
MSESTHVVCPHCVAINRVPVAKLPQGAHCGKCKQLLFNAHPIELSAANFTQHLQHNDIPLVVDFWAPWCGPCKMMAPVFEQAARQLEPYTRLGKLNTEVEQVIAARFGIRSIPTLIIFKGGLEIARQAGAMDINSLVKWVRSTI